MSESRDRIPAEGLLRQQLLLDRVLTEIADRAPKGWVRIEAVLVLLGQIRHIEFEISTADGPFDGPPPSLFPPTAPELRDVMYVEGRGTWFSLSLTLWSSGEASTAFDYDNRPSLRASLGHVVRDDLEMYPRDVLPQWMVDELAGIDEEDRIFRERAARPGFEGSDDAEDVLEASEPCMDRHTAREMARGYVPEEPGWSYIKITYAERGARDPVMVFAELDEDRYEFRKVEIFANGLLGFADYSFYTPTTATSDDPLPSMEELAKLPEVVEAELISPEEFQEEWLVASGLE